ncbi:unnamed protein product, partial [Discosporangium mesarthrocarpum]
ELLNEDYVITKKLSVVTTTSNGVVFTTRGEVDGRSVRAKLGATVRNEASGLNLDALEFTSDGRILADASLALSECVRLIVRAEDGRQEKGKVSQSNGKLGIEYVTPGVGLTGEVDVVDGPKVGGSVLLNYGNFITGGLVQYNSQVSK